MQLQIDDQTFEIHDGAKPYRKWVGLLRSLAYWSGNPFKSIDQEKHQIIKEENTIKNQLHLLKCIQLPETPEDIDAVKKWYAAQPQIKELTAKSNALYYKRRALDNTKSQKNQNVVKVKSESQVQKEQTPSLMSWILADFHHQNPETLISVSNVIKVIQNIYERWNKT